MGRGLPRYPCGVRHSLRRGSPGGRQGTYSIGVGRSLTLVSGAEDMKEAVTKAGEYCHSKSLKLLVVPNTGNDVTFRCVSSDDDVAPPVSEQRRH